MPGNLAWALLGPGRGKLLQGPARVPSWALAARCAPCACTAPRDNACNVVPLQEIDQLYKIFQVMGTPDESSWQGVSQLPDYKDTFPKWRPKDLAAVVPSLGPAGVDLLSRMLVYVPQYRITARAAMQVMGGCGHVNASGEWSR